MIEQNRHEYQIPANLRDKVICRLEKERKLAVLRKKFWGWAIVSVLMAIACAMVERIFMLQITQSGFSEYLTLIFSDFQTVTGAWQDFVLSLLESLPALTTAELLATILAFLISLYYAIRYSKSNISLETV